MNQRQIEREWNALLKSEKTLIEKAFPIREKGWQKKIEKYVPEKLESTLNRSFYKAFELIFEKGTALFEICSGSAGCWCAGWCFGCGLSEENNGLCSIKI